MDVAVIITLFNGAKWIRQTLEAVLSQEHRPVEVVVVDDGSEDESPDMVRAFPGVMLLRNPGKGAQLACEFGFRQTTAPLVTFLDHDDIWHPAHLRILNSILEENPECPAAIGTCRFFKSDDNLIFPPPRLNAVPFDPWVNFPDNKIDTNSAVLIRRDAMNAMGGWPTQFGGYSDVYTWLRLSVAKPLMENRSATVGYRQHESSMSIDLRSREVESYFNQAIAASEDAFARRLAIYPQDSDRLKNRLAILTPMSNILKATIHFDRQLLKESALVFEENVASESTKFIRAILGMVIWFLTPSSGIETQVRKTEVFKFLLENWPKEAANSRQSLLVYIIKNLPMGTSGRFLLTSPWQLQSWKLFTNVVYLKLLCDRMTNS